MTILSNLVSCNKIEPSCNQYQLQPECKYYEREGLFKRDHLQDSMNAYFQYYVDSRDIRYF